MSAANSVKNFRPSKNGFHFSNSYPSGTAYPAVTLPLLGTIVSGDAGNGLCGGFAFAARDIFQIHQVPPPGSSLPPAGGPLFNYLSSRLLQSFGSSPIYDNAAKVIQWIQTPSHDVTISFYGSGLGDRMVKDEWPKIKADIDAGNPSPLNLVMGPECGAGDIPGIIAALHHCHQVLAYAYSLDNQNNLTLTVYDCNNPDNDNVTIEMNIGDPSHTISINAPLVMSALGEASNNMRGVFRSDYEFRDPTSIVPTEMSIVSPAANSTVSGTINLVAQAQCVEGVGFSAYYATSPANIQTVGWHLLGQATAQANGTWTLSYDTRSIPDQGNAGWGTVNICAFATDFNGNAGTMANRVYQRVNIHN